MWWLKSLKAFSNTYSELIADLISLVILRCQKYRMAVVLLAYSEVKGVFQREAVTVCEKYSTSVTGGIINY